MCACYDVDGAKDQVSRRLTTPVGWSEHMGGERRERRIYIDSRMMMSVQYWRSPSDRRSHTSDVHISAEAVPLQSRPHAVENTVGRPSGTHLGKSLRQLVHTPTEHAIMITSQRQYTITHILICTHWSPFIAGDHPHRPSSTFLRHATLPAHGGHRRRLCAPPEPDSSHNPSRRPPVPCAIRVAVAQGPDRGSTLR